MIHSASFRARGSPIAASACVASAGLCLRTSSMTFSKAALSSAEVEDVAATAAGADGLRTVWGGSAACWRVAGAITAPGGLKEVEKDAGVETLGFVLAAVLSVLSAIFAARLRAIGRVLGKGTFDLALDSLAHAVDTMTSASAVATAVEHNAFARTYEITAFPCGESQDAVGSRSS